MIQRLWCSYQGKPLTIPMPCTNQYFVQVFSEDGNPIYNFGSIKGRDTLTLFSGLTLDPNPSDTPIPFGKYLIVISHPI